MAENKSNGIDYFSREGSDAVTPEMLPDLIRRMKGKVAASVRNQENLVRDGAYAIHAAVRVDENWTVSGWAKEIGLGRTAVYTHQRMGVAIMDLDVQEKSVEWTCLVGKSGATSEPISWVLSGLGRDGGGDEATRGETKSKNFKPGEANIVPTREDLDWALRVVFQVDENGNLTSERRPAKEIKAAIAEVAADPAKQSANKQEQENGGDGGKGEQPTPFEVLLGALRFAAENLDQISDRQQFESLVPLIKQINGAARNVDKATRVAESA